MLAFLIWLQWNLRKKIVGYSFCWKSRKGHLDGSVWFRSAQQLYYWLSIDQTRRRTLCPQTAAVGSACLEDEIIDCFYPDFWTHSTSSTSPVTYKFLYKYVLPPEEWSHRVRPLLPALLPRMILQLCILPETGHISYPVSTLIH